MPVYNGESFIRDALDSLINQTFADFELIISDNASTDRTEAFCLEYAEKDQRIRYVRQTENIGGLYNYKFVLDEAVGEYFMWAAADDIWSFNFIESNLINLCTNSALVGSISRVIFCEANYTQVSNAVSPITGLKMNRLLKFWRDPGDNSRIYSLFKRSALVTTNFDKYNFHAADWLVVAKILEFGEFGSVDDALITRDLTPAENYIKDANRFSLMHSTFGFDLLPLTCYYFRSLSCLECIRLLPCFLLLNFKIFKSYNLYRLSLKRPFRDLIKYFHI